jgi:hypothetical protein
MGLIKNIIAGIFSFITGLFSSKKKGSGYYRELKESQSAPVSKPAATATKPVAVASAPAATKTKAAKAEKSNNGKVVTPQPVVATKTSNPADVAFASKYLLSSSTTSNGRRRPGANMSTFLDLASQVKTSN